MSEIMEQTPAENKGGRPLKTTNDLTEREMEIMQMIINGYTTSEIAQYLYVGVTTIESHRRNIFNKLKVANIAEAIAYCFRNKIIE